MPMQVKWVIVHAPVVEYKPVSFPRFKHRRVRLRIGLPVQEPLFWSP
jgi:hypothetical protein